jgi:hypothetical protein
MPSREPARGLARARTGLAWERSALVHATLAGVVLGVAAHRDAPAVVPFGIALLAVAAAVWRRGRRAYAWEDVAAQPRALALLTASTAVAALTAAALVLARL